MKATDALKAYGYTRDDSGLWLKITGGRLMPTQVWKETDGGFLRLDPPHIPIGSVLGGTDPANGAPWGKPVVDEHGQAVNNWIQVPWKQSDRFATASGLHPLTHSECFEWVWPEKEIAFMYQYAHTAGFHPDDGVDNPWVRQNDGSMKRVAL